MGCFYGTCAVTGLPIRQDDQVTAFIVSNRGRSGGRTNSMSLTGAVSADDSIFPVSGFIHGRYNDYGSIEGVETGPLGPLWLSNVSRSFGVSFEAMDEAMDSISRDDVEGLGLWMARREVVAEILATPFEDDWVSDAVAERDQLLVAGVRHLFASLPAIEDALSMSREMLVHLEKVREQSFNAPNLGSLQNQFSMHLMDPNTYRAGDVDGTVEMCREYSSLCRLNSLLGELRRTWGPLSGRGSQTLALDAHRRLAMATAKSLASIEDYYDEPEPQSATL